MTITNSTVEIEIETNNNRLLCNVKVNISSLYKI